MDWLESEFRRFWLRMQPFVWQISTATGVLSILLTLLLFLNESPASNPLVESDETQGSRWEEDDPFAEQQTAPEAPIDTRTSRKGPAQPTSEVEMASGEKTADHREEEFLPNTPQIQADEPQFPEAEQQEPEHDIFSVPEPMPPVAAPAPTRRPVIQPVDDTRGPSRFDDDFDIDRSRDSTTTVAPRTTTPRATTPRTPTPAVITPPASTPPRSTRPSLDDFDLPARSTTPEPKVEPTTVPHEAHTGSSTRVTAPPARSPAVTVPEPEEELSFDEPEIAEPVAPPVTRRTPMPMPVPSVAQNPRPRPSFGEPEDEERPEAPARDPLPTPPAREEIPTTPRTPPARDEFPAKPRTLPPRDVDDPVPSSRDDFEPEPSRRAPPIAEPEPPRRIEPRMPNVVRPRSEPAPAATPEYDEFAPRDPRAAVGPQLRLEVDGPREVSVGNVVVLTFRVTNVGDAPAENVRLHDVLPAQLQHSQSQDLEYRAGRIEPGQTRVAQIRATAVSAGQVSNSVRGIAAGGVNTAADVRLQVVGQGGGYNAGQFNGCQPPPSWMMNSCGGGWMPW